jgi:hypothetical protein
LEIQESNPEKRNSYKAIIKLLMVDFRIEAAAVIMTQRGKISKGIYPFVFAFNHRFSKALRERSTEG